MTAQKQYNINMASSFLQFFFLVCGVFFVPIFSSMPDQIPKRYIVYMGGSSNGINEIGNGKAEEYVHLQLLSSVIPSEEESARISLLHSYGHAFKGFSAMLTENEASLLSARDGIVSVFPDRVLELHTTRSWDFLDEQSGIRSSGRHHRQVSGDIIIGVIDTGIWPESPSFNDHGMGEIPSRWKGVCMEGSDFKKTNCNRKLIGARYYNIEEEATDGMQQQSDKSRRSAGKRKEGSPRDFGGHGTHTASTAGGASIGEASYYGLGKGRARGGLPSARIASYKACSIDGCNGGVILKAIDDAIKDGVDLISISIGMTSVFQPDFLSDPIAIGSFHAQQLGVMVVCSAGNDGPDPYTVVNTAPWIFTIGASTIDRDFTSTLILGNGKTFRGSAINFSNLTRSATYPLAFGEKVASSFTPASDARNCRPGSLDLKKAAGKIIVCISTEPGLPKRVKKLVVEDARAKGMILIDEEARGVPFDSGIFPFTGVGEFEGAQILKYINSTKNPTATIIASTTVLKSRPAPVVAAFSSRGPGGLTENILKPDIVAPGVAILAAMVPPKADEGEGVPFGKKPSPFGIRSGTSMACPHVTGAAAVIKSVHHGWSSSMIKSALMTTATLYNNERKPLTNSSNYMANPHESGVGEISVVKALDPGLVFETTKQDYLNFLCYYGYEEKIVRSMAKSKFSCPNNSKEDLIPNINYPSISIARLSSHRGVKIVKRILTNVGPPNSSYIASVHSPLGLDVVVSPKVLVFTDGVTRASLKVSFHAEKALKGYNYGDITWFDGLHKVHLVFAVNVD